MAVSSVAALLVVSGLPTRAQAAKWRGWDVAGFVENVTRYRDSNGPVGLTKQRTTAQLEYAKPFGGGLSISGIFRGSYDAVYDINDDEFGDDAGGSVTIENAGGSGFAGLPERVPWGQSLVGTGTLGFGFDLANNPNEGLLLLGNDLRQGTGGSFPALGGVQLASPAQPCDQDSRGCIGSYMNKDKNDLRFPEFNEKLDFIRELYVDWEYPFESGKTLNVRLGRQQAVCGRTDLFRVLDVVNPVDCSRHNIYDELEDIRIPMGILSTEMRFGATGPFDDLNLRGLWNFEPFRPNDLGQGGQPHSILPAGNFFRVFTNCWDNGCTVGDFAPAGFDETGAPVALLATDFAAQSIGIKNFDVPDEWGATAVGGRLEGVWKGIGFSLNALSYRSQLPSLRGTVENDNPSAVLCGTFLVPYSTNHRLSMSFQQASEIVAARFGSDDAEVCLERPPRQKGGMQWLTTGWNRRCVSSATRRHAGSRFSRRRQA